MNNQDSMPRVKKETKNKIVVDFDRTPLKERLKAKYLNGYFYKKLFIAIFKFVLLLGISYIILFPFFSKISSSFMSPKDFLQSDVKLIPKYPTTDTWKFLVTENHYFKALLNTFLLSVSNAVIQTFICAMIGYGFAKFKFKGNNLLFLIVVLTMIVPPQILASSLVTRFMYPEISIFGIEWLSIDLSKLCSAIGWNMGLYNTYVPIYFLSLTGLAFKNGLFIYIMRQYYRGVPDELEESSYVDGYGVIQTFLKIILPISVPMLITVFILSFAWQWTDIFYTNTFLNSSEHLLLTSNSFWQTMPASLAEISSQAGGSIDSFTIAVKNTAGLLIIAPLVLMYLFCQRYLIQGIESSGFGGM